MTALLLQSFQFELSFKTTSYLERIAPSIEKSLRLGSQWSIKQQYAVGTSVTKTGKSLSRIHNDDIA